MLDVWVRHKIYLWRLVSDGTWTSGWLSLCVTLHSNPDEARMFWKECCTTSSVQFVWKRRPRLYIAGTLKTCASNLNPKRNLLRLDAPQGPCRDVDCWQTRNENGLVMFSVVISLTRVWRLRRNWHLQCGRSALVLLLQASCPARDKKTWQGNLTAQLNQHPWSFSHSHRMHTFLTACLLWGSAAGHRNNSTEM